ncbi:MAG: hypothetical protein LC777_02890 [Actinobacteria bacterium]|nr:hypothetical protein [Actinomycetota bacterium]
MVTWEQFWLLAHIAVGVMFLHAIAGGITTLVNSGTMRLKETRLKQAVRAWSTVVMAAFVWLAVVSGTWLVYPGYRAVPPDGSTDLVAYPKAALLADANLSVWHDFGMEWKEHVAWIAPFLATAVAFIVIRYAPLVTRDARLRRVLAHVPDRRARRGRRRGARIGDQQGRAQPVPCPMSDRTGASR